MNKYIASFHAKHDGRCRQRRHVQFYATTIYGHQIQTRSIIEMHRLAKELCKTTEALRGDHG